MSRILNLLRINQWYKNLVIFLPIVFALQLFNQSALIKTILGFLALCLISSVNYIINDVVDKEKDKLHPEKKSRPIASGKISIGAAISIAIILLFIASAISITLSKSFFFIVLALFLFTQLYTFKLKHEPFADILAISINFVLRAISGIFIINVALGHWIIICTFFLALFLVTSKRKAELIFLKSMKAEHRKVLEVYDEEILNALLIISTTLLIISYAFFISLSKFENLFITFPIILYLIFTYINFAFSESAIARNPELVFKNKKFLAALLLYLVATIIILYWSLSNGA